MIVSNIKSSPNSRRGQEICNKMYSLTKSILIKALTIKQRMEEVPFLHVFNDHYHPLRFATEKKLEYLYENLSKGEISDSDCVSLVHEMYGLAGSFSMNE